MTYEEYEFLAKLAGGNTLDQLIHFFDRFDHVQAHDPARFTIVAVQAGSEHGLTPMQSLAYIRCIRRWRKTSSSAPGASMEDGIAEHSKSIDGSLSIHGLLELLRSSNKYTYKVTRSDHAGASVQFFARSELAGEISFTREDAERQEIL